MRSLVVVLAVALLAFVASVESRKSVGYKHFVKRQTNAAVKSFNKALKASQARGY